MDNVLLAAPLHFGGQLHQKLELSQEFHNNVEKYKSKLENMRSLSNSFNA